MSEQVGTDSALTPALENTYVLLKTQGKESEAHQELEVAFDNYCRSAGALDLFDLFSIHTGDGLPLADSVLARFPGTLIERLRALFGGPREDNEKFFNAGNWGVVKNFILGYTLESVELVQGIYVPVFCAHPVEGIADSTVTVETDEKTSRGIEFQVHVPGVNGGIGSTQELAFSGKVENSPYSYQWQVKLSALLRKWVSDRDSKQTICPIPYVGTPETKETDSSRPDYLNYDASKKRRPIKVHVQALSRDSSKGLGLSIGGKDEFELKLPIGAATSSLKITSTCSQEFKVQHTLPPGYRYVWYGLDDKPGRCHDIHVKATKTT